MSDTDDDVKHLDNEFDEVRNPVRIWFARLCASRFNDKSLRSKSAALADRDLVKMDYKSLLRGRWNSRMEFLLSCIGFSVGLGSVWRFPIRVYENGGGAILIPYLLMCILLGMPMIMLELGLGQFTGQGPTNAFKCVPVFFAIGWGMVMITSVILTYYGVVIAWAVFYMFASFTFDLPWVRCNHRYNTPACLGSNQERSMMPAINGSIKLVSSTQEYWNFYVTGFMKQSSGLPMQMSENPGSPQWHLALCLCFVWFIAAVSLMFGVKVSGKIVYFTSIFPYLGFILMIILGATLKGSGAGVNFYLKPNFYIMVQPKNLLAAMEQLFFSTSIAMGGLITLSSYNDFHDNFFRDAIIIVLAELLASFLSGFAVFLIIGHMAYRLQQPISKVITAGPGLFFVTYPEALAVLPGANFWTFIFMLMVISIGADSLFTMFESISTALGDKFSVLRRTRWHKATTVVALCLVYCLIGLLLTTQGGIYWFAVLDTRVSSYGLPFLGMSECIVIGCVYGIKQFRLDVRMMLGFSPNWFWFITMGYVAPIIIGVIIIASFIRSSPITVNGKKIPLWGEIVAILVFLITIFPVFLGIVLTAIKYQRRYRDMSWCQYVSTLITPPVFWGPYYKTNWLKSKFYQDKLLRLKDNPNFMMYVPEVENINEIMKAARKS